jgi:hypothetical protein
MQQHFDMEMHAAATRKQLGQLMTVKKDVCPLLVAHPTDSELVYHAREWRL